MGITKLATPVMGMGVEELTNLMFKYYRELEYLLNGNIDSDNVLSITTDKLIAGTALIDTALITTLVVGTNVGIGSAPKVFNSQPTTPYRVNDIWIDGTDLKRCTVARSSGAYVATDWGLGTNYTNPTGVTSIVGGVITTDYVNALNVTAAHVVAGELIVGTNVGIGSAPIVFSSTPTTPYRINDIWINGTDLKRCTTARATGTYVVGDWGLGTNYTNPTGVTSIVGGVITTDFVNALNVTAAHIAAEGITSGTISGVTIDVGTDLTVGNNVTIGNTYTGNIKEITFFTSANTDEEANITANRPNYPTDNYSSLAFGARNIRFVSYNRPQWGLEDLALDSQFASYYTKTEANGRYVKTSQDLYIQYFSDHMEIKSTAGGTYKLITYDP